MRCRGGDGKNAHYVKTVWHMPGLREQHAAHLESMGDARDDTRLHEATLEQAPSCGDTLEKVAFRDTVVSPTKLKSEIRADSCAERGAASVAAGMGHGASPLWKRLEQSATNLEAAEEAAASRFVEGRCSPRREESQQLSSETDVEEAVSRLERMGVSRDRAVAALQEVPV